MKNSIIVSAVFALVFSYGFWGAPSSAEAACSINGYIHSGGKCAQSWEKKEKHNDDEDDNEEHSWKKQNFKWEYSYDTDYLQAYINQLLAILRALEDRDDDDTDNDDSEIEVRTLAATNIDEDGATLRAVIDMNDFESGVAFFVFGEDEDEIGDVEDDFTSYDDVDEDGDILRKSLVDSDVDDIESYTKNVTGLDEDTEIFFSLCVEYDDEDDDETLQCGSVREFTTN